jgi:hypothetical protein
MTIGRGRRGCAPPQLLELIGENAHPKRWSRARRRVQSRFWPEWLNARTRLQARSSSESGERASCIAEDDRQRAACFTKYSRCSQQAIMGHDAHRGRRAGRFFCTVRRVGSNRSASRPPRTCGVALPLLLPLLLLHTMVSIVIGRHQGIPVMTRRARSRLCAPTALPSRFRDEEISSIQFHVNS